ncbi:MAG TPA: TrmH family RNA methyltransferase [Bdellovibrionota bacterium]|nr:TrmH family RNA methyltransferase [Bdellovibrionota bacterium]
MRDLRLILVEPQGARNLGACARLAANFGVSDWVIVRPVVPLDDPEAVRCATGDSAEWLSRARVAPDLATALADRELAVAFCGKTPGPRSPAPISLDDLAQSPGKIALVFGNERTGLSADDVSLCNRVCSIPTAGLDSLNLSHAVAIALSRFHEAAPVREPEFATHGEIEAMLSHAGSWLAEMGLAEHGRILVTFRRLFDRARLRAHEVRALRTVFSKTLQRISTSGIERMKSGPNASTGVSAPAGGGEEIRRSTAASDESTVNR